jgi:hypothetical protein
MQGHESQRDAAATPATRYKHCTVQGPWYKGQEPCILVAALGTRTLPLLVSGNLTPVGPALHTLAAPWSARVPAARPLPPVTVSLSDSHESESGTAGHAAAGSRAGARRRVTGTE